MDKEIFSFNEEVISNRITTILNRLEDNNSDYKKALDSLYKSTVKLSCSKPEENSNQESFEKVLSDYFENMNTVNDIRMHTIYTDAIFNSIAMLIKYGYIKL